MTHKEWIKENKYMADLDVAGIVDGGIQDYVILIDDLEKYLAKIDADKAELVEALKDALLVIRKCIPNESIVPVPGICPKIENAIAKAEGK